MNGHQIHRTKSPRLYQDQGAMPDLYQQPRPKNIPELKVALKSIRNNLPHDPIDRSILSFTRRLRACIKGNSEHFEYQ